MPTFTAHNMRLSDGRFTFPANDLIESSGRFMSAMRTLAVFFRREDYPSTSLADLGCLEGGYSVGFARAGFKVTGIEARDRNLECCRYVERDSGLSNLRFVKDDARNVAEYGPFDVVFCCGLLYHLDQPREFLQILAGSTRRLLILDTHYAEVRVPPAYAAALSGLVAHEGNVGRWYHEFAEDATDDEIRDARWSSWGNRRSFWIERTHLLQDLVEVGFDVVYEQQDTDDDLLASRFRDELGRSTFIAVKPQD